VFYSWFLEYNGDPKLKIEGELAKDLWEKAFKHSILYYFHGLKGNIVGAFEEIDYRNVSL
jgi:hypothetical protein